MSDKSAPVRRKTAVNVVHSLLLPSQQASLLALFSYSGSPERQIEREREREREGESGNSDEDDLN